VVDDKEQGRVPFSAVELDGGMLVGTATLWDIDHHNRPAHVGLGLLPSARCKGYGTDVVALLCHYGFVVRGLQRLQIETLSDNAAMLRSAERNVFVREGVLRSSAWVMGEFLDEVLLGLLVQDWKPDSKGLAGQGRRSEGCGTLRGGPPAAQRRVDRRSECGLGRGGVEGSRQFESHKPVQGHPDREGDERRFADEDGLRQGAIDRREERPDGVAGADCAGRVEGLHSTEQHRVEVAVFASPSTVCGGQCVQIGKGVPGGRHCRHFLEQASHGSVAYLADQGVLAAEQGVHGRRRRSGGSGEGADRDRLSRTGGEHLGRARHKPLFDGLVVRSRSTHDEQLTGSDNVVLKQCSETSF
jgi:hypothetical protein